MLLGIMIGAGPGQRREGNEGMLDLLVDELCVCLWMVDCGLWRVRYGVCVGVFSGRRDDRWLGFLGLVDES
jgi:hypothetical protein